MKAALLTVVAALVLVGCGKADVPWSDYDPGLQGRIDAAGCAQLQVMFDQADANNTATMRRTGHNNADLMTYIDDTMRDKDCY
jgi:hypothetical protein